MKNLMRIKSVCLPNLYYNFKVYFRVVQRLSSVPYLIENIKSKKREQTVHVKQLKKYISRVHDPLLSEKKKASTMNINDYILSNGSSDAESENEEIIDNHNYVSRPRNAFNYTEKRKENGDTCCL